MLRWFESTRAHQKRSCKLNGLQGLFVFRTPFGTTLSARESFQISTEDFVHLGCNAPIIIVQLMGVDATCVHTLGLAAQPTKIALGQILRQRNKGVPHFIATNVWQVI